MAEKVRLNELKPMNIGDIIETLSLSYSKLINDKVDLNLFPSVMLWGQPGVGKSEAIDQICRNITKMTGKKAVKTDVRLLLFNPIDLRGIPVADTDNDGERVAKWLKPYIFKMDPSDDVVNILFLDEISAAPQSVQAAAYQITLDKKVGEHSLPKNCFVIAAGNRVSDKSVANKMPKALANRLMHFDVMTDFDSWKKWAIENNVNPMILGFLSFKPNLLNTFDTTSEHLAFATPRSWVMVSNLLNYISDDIDKVYQQICGLVGTGNAVELRTWSKFYKNLPNIDDIFAGKKCKVPTEPSVIFAVSCSIIQHAKRYKNDMKSVINSIKYASQFPKDFSMLIVEEYLNNDEELKNKLLKEPEFIRWVSSQGFQLSGVGNGAF